MIVTIDRTIAAAAIAHDTLLRYGATIGLACASDLDKKGFAVHERAFNVVLIDADFVRVSPHMNTIVLCSGSDDACATSMKAKLTALADIIADKARSHWFEDAVASNDGELNALA